MFVLETQNLIIYKVNALTTCPCIVRVPPKAKMPLSPNNTLLPTIKYNLDS